MATYGQLTDRLLAAGHDYLADRAGPIIQEAVQELYTAERWLFRLRNHTTDGRTAAPGIGQITVVYVTDTGKVLPYAQREDVTAAHPDIFTATGEPVCWYEAGWEWITPYPLLAVGRTITVRSFATRPWIAADGNPLAVPADTASVTFIPDQFSDVVLILARLKALEDSDETKLRNDLAERYVSRLTDMQDQAISHHSRDGIYVQASGDWA